MMTKKLMALSFVFLLSQFPLFSQENAQAVHRISGKVVFKGKGIEGVEIGVDKEEEYHRPRKRRIRRNGENMVVTDYNGNFFFYAQKGIYNLYIGNMDDYVCKKNNS